MIRILAGASPVLRNVKPSMGGVCVCALGHCWGRQRFCSGRDSTDVPQPHCRLDMPLDSCRFPEPSASQVGRISEVEVDLSGVVRGATASLEYGT